MKDRRDRIRDTLDGTARLLTIAILLFLSLIPEVFGIIAPPEYYGAYSVIYPVAASVLFSFLASTLTTVIMHYEMGSVITRNTLICATVSVISCILLVNRLGLIGGAASTLISYFLLSSLNLFSAKRLIGEPIVSYEKSAFSIVLLFIGTVLLFMLRHSLLSRFFIILSLLIIFLREGTKLKGLFLR